jgi:hypothetical protein
MRQRSGGGVASVSAGVLGTVDMAAGHEDEDCKPGDSLARVEVPSKIDGFS